MLSWGEVSGGSLPLLHGVVLVQVGPDPLSPPTLGASPTRAELSSASAPNRSSVIPGSVRTRHRERDVPLVRHVHDLGYAATDRRALLDPLGRARVAPP